MGDFFVSNAEKPKTPYKVDYNALLTPQPDLTIKNESFMKPYFDFMQEVFDTMDREYYLPVSKEAYDSFKNEFKNKVLLRLKDKTNLVEDIKYAGAGLLVQKLKEPRDIFSAFIPPIQAEEFKSEVLGYELGIGITGHIMEKGYLIEKVELRSDSYAKGIRMGDIILKINNEDVLKLPEDKLKSFLYPELGKLVNLEILFKETNKTASVEVKTIEFFKETLASIPTGIPGMYYIKINQFNQKTGDDFIMLIKYFMSRGMNRLVIDLRGNAGGPPLAAREIANIFYTPGTEMFYFQRKNRPKVLLKTLPSPVYFTGEIAVLVDKGTGSSSELFSGIMQYYKRAIIIGNEPSAGRTFLKSMFNFEDKSMLMLVTSAAYLANGQTYSLDGIQPDYWAKPEYNLFPFISECLDKTYGKK